MRDSSGGIRRDLKADSGFEWRDARRLKSGYEIRVARCEKTQKRIRDSSGKMRKDLRADAGFEWRDEKRLKSGFGIRVAGYEEI
ncbi:hypothetical protein VFDL14_03145 [Vibrio fortis]|uniref:Uncharacterized protein n=1 Tax=Vibrio fortis TaxID=212667 RepID=A0A066ULQ5_9VIBR|nr:hypothetical protein VFDL14_03145 [Vibrio fortis]